MTYLEYKKQYQLDPENYGLGEDYFTKGQPEKCVDTGVVRGTVDGTAGFIRAFRAVDGTEFAIEHTPTSSLFISEDDIPECD